MSRFGERSRSKMVKVLLSEVVTLQGGAWDEKRFEMLKKQNPKGKLAVHDESGQVFIVPIGNLTIVQE
jgi:hypothetical protein